MRLMVFNKSYLIVIVLVIYSDFSLIYSIMFTNKHDIMYSFIDSPRHIIINVKIRHKQGRSLH